MVRTTFLMAFLFVLLGAVFYFIAGEARGHLMTLTPAALGVLLAFCATIVAAKPSLRKHVMHVAMLLALLGFFAMIMPLTISLKPGGNALMLTEVSLTMAMCVAYLVLGVRSFIAARRSGQTPTTTAGADS